MSDAPYSSGWRGMLEIIQDALSGILTWLIIAIAFGIGIFLYDRFGLGGLIYFPVFAATGALLIFQSIRGAWRFLRSARGRIK